MNKTKKITISGIMIAMYVAVMYFTQGFAFGQYQIRIATALYGLGYIFPFLIIPMGIANLISNTIMGGLGIFDMFGGAIVGMIATSLVVLIKKLNLPKYLIILPITFVPGLIVPIWLSILIHIPYIVLVVSLCVGQFISAIVSYTLVKILENKLKEITL